MALRDLLVYLGNDPARDTRVKVAMDLAAVHDAHLTGLHVLAPPEVPIRGGAEIARVIQDLQRRLREEAERTQALFRDHAARAGIRFEWRAVEGRVRETAILHARYSDLTIVAQGLDLDPEPEEVASLPEELVLAVGRPVLVVPRYGSFTTVGQRILVAWNGSREATRAVNDALPLLARARTVTVLSIDPEGEAARVPGADIALHLARHGVNVEATRTTAADLNVGDLLLSYAFDHGVDLIVMGAYGHSRLRELVLGGATRHLLRHMTVPVLLAH
jgi:nucleotide-binding universal stress UspA family protein